MTEFVCFVILPGANWYGQCGYPEKHIVGEKRGTLPPDDVDLGPDYVATAVTCGSSHTCAILDSGEVKCWGKFSLDFPAVDPQHIIQLIVLLVAL
jgi:alpha-tubulin suppressor-like RCC1 family protein